MGCVLQKPPPGGGFYIEPNNENASIPTKGTGAFLRSTKFYVYIVSFTYLYIFILRVSVVTKPMRVFLFAWKTDKPPHVSNLFRVHITPYISGVWLCYIAKYP